MNVDVDTGWWSLGVSTLILMLCFLPTPTRLGLKVTLRENFFALKARPT